MALAAVPGLGEAVLATSAGAAAAKANMGEKEYESTRGVATWGWSAAVSFLPINIGLWPFQFGLFIVFLLIFIFVFGAGWYSVPLAWIAQGIIIMMVYHWFFDKILRIGFGV